MRLLIIATITFAYSAAFAQKYTITKGKEGGMNIKEANNKFDEDDKHYYFFKEDGKREKKNISVSKIDKTTLKKDWEQNVNISNFKYELPIEFKPVFTDKKIMLFANYFNKEKQEGQLFLKIISLDGKTEKDWFQLSSVNSDIPSFNWRAFYYVISPDKSKFLIVSQFKWPKKPQEVSAQFYDISTMEKIGPAITLPDIYKAGGISSENYKLDNAGNFTYLFYFLAHANDENTSLGIGIYPANSKTPKVVELPLEKGKELTNFIVTTTKDGKIMYSGFFKDAAVKNSKKERRAGMYNYLIDINGANLASSDFQYFPDDVEAKLHYTDGGVGAPSGKKYFGIKSVTEMDGAHYLFANHKYSVSSGSGGTAVEREFVITKIDGKGKIEWIKVYPKYTTGRLNSYNMMVHNHKIYVFYLEHDKNLEKSTLQEYNANKYKPLINFHSSVIVGMELNADGSASRKVIENKQELFYEPTEVDLLLEKENSLLFPIINGDNKSLYILKVE